MEIIFYKLWTVYLPRENSRPLCLFQISASVSTSNTLSPTVCVFYPSTTCGHRSSNLTIGIVTYNYLCTKHCWLFIMLNTVSRITICDTGIPEMSEIRPRSYLTRYHNIPHLNTFKYNRYNLFIFEFLYNKKKMNFLLSSNKLFVRNHYWSRLYGKFFFSIANKLLSSYKYEYNEC